MSQGMIHGSSTNSYLYTKTNILTKTHINQSPFSNTQLCIPSTSKSPIKKLYVNYVRIISTRASAVKDVYSETYEEKTMSLYELLGVSESVSFAEMKKAHKRLALKFHPDLSPPEQAEEFTMKFIRVQEAYETLSDPQSRALYDKNLANGLHLTFSTRRRVHHDQKCEGRDNWESQLMRLHKRSARKDSDKGHMSWAARIRAQETERTD